ncbi:MAG: hypothetical protein CO141_03200 [Candidatus Moranbacteria bacterium CG_4_9_14_3_um_filter_42_9]|nr:MAG: hypothetical protein CO141_03200 [Candidatus Moranbacteria bacterium CG_4_9_14_3_um_filter_42_9]
MNPEKPGVLSLSEEEKMKIRKKYFPRPPEHPWDEEPEKTKKPAQSEKKMVKRICAKCQKELGEVAAVGGKESHGLCPECAKTYYWEKETEGSGE